MSTTVSSSLGDEAECEAFHATLAFLDEYDGDIDLALPHDSDHSYDDIDSSDAGSWTASPAPTTSASDEPSQSEVDSEVAFSPGASPLSSPLQSKVSPNPNPTPSTAKPKKKNSTTGKRRHNAQVDDPRMSAKTAAEGAYPSRTRRAELEYLRGKVGELEERLRVIKHTKRPSENDHDHDHGKRLLQSEQTLDTSPSDPWELAVAQQHAAGAAGSGDSMWEEFAMRQFEQRQQSEIENQRLRSMLESQLKLARGLERLLKRTNADLILPTNQLKRPRLSPDGRADATAFHDLMRVIDGMYLQLDGVFSDPHFDHEDAPLRDIQVSHDTAVGTVVDVFDARNLPFDLRSTADAVWGYFANMSVSYAHQPIEVTDDVLKKHFDFTVEVQRYQSHFRGRLAGRRYFEEDRIVILWVAMIEPEMVGGGSSEGMVVRQKGWTIIKRPNPLPPNCDADAPVARIQSKHVAIPYVYDDVPDHKRRAGTLTNFVLQSVYSHLQTSRKIIENVLIEGAMKK